MVRGAILPTVGIRGFRRCPPYGRGALALP